MKVISIRQPWAAFIFANSGHWKNVENRTWPTRERGNVLIHAAKGMTDEEYEAAKKFAWQCGLFNVPPKEDIKRGGIVGIVRLVDCVKTHRSLWFTGPYGFVFRDPYPLPFEPCAGQRGFWEYGTFAPPTWAKSK